MAGGSLEIQIDHLVFPDETHPLEGALRAVASRIHRLHAVWSPRHGLIRDRRPTVAILVAFPLDSQFDQAACGAIESVGFDLPSHRVDLDRHVAALRLEVVMVY